MRGERGRRTDAASQNVSGTRETEPQFLAALDKNVRAPITQWCFLETLRCSRAVSHWFSLLALGRVSRPAWPQAARHAGGISWRDLLHDEWWGPPGGHSHLCRSSGLQRGCKLARPERLSPCSIAQAVDNTKPNPGGPTDPAHNWNTDLRFNPFSEPLSRELKPLLLIVTIIGGLLVPRLTLK